MDTDPLPALPALLLNATDPQVISSFSVAQIIALLIAVFALMLSAFVSGSEIAFFSLTPSQVEDLDDSPKSNAIRKLLLKPERLLATILITNNLVNVTIVVLCNFAFGPVFADMPEILSFILQSVLLTFLILLFGEILPKLYGSNYPLRWAMFATGGIKVLMWLCSPFSRLLVRSSFFVRKVVGRQPRNITADELSHALEITDVAPGEQKTMLEGILKFGDTTADEIMTPRTEVTALDMDMTFDEVMKEVIESGYSRLPVCRETLDDVCGILFARDLLPYIQPEDRVGFDWHTLLREPYYVPESKMIDDLLEEFRRLKMHLAIVVDEYGGTQGIVTLEDVLEEIVGDINDEYDDEEQTFKRLRDDTYIFEGRTLLGDFFRITGLDPDDYTQVTEDSETLAGMLLAIKGDFPSEKEPLVFGRCRFLVLNITDHRITEVRVKVMPEDQPDSAKIDSTD